MKAWWCALVSTLVLISTGAKAQFDPAKVIREPDAVAGRFQDPDVRYPTPSLREGRADFASHSEVLAYLDELARASEGRLKVETIGTSQEGRSIPMALLAAHGVIEQSLPTVFVIAQQHGNEPAGGEAALALVQQLSGPQAQLLDRVNVVVVPRANPDGAEHFVRTSRSGIDVNRDHLLLRTPEARAIAHLMVRYRPHVVLDLHEFTVAGRWVEKFAAMQKYDALIQAASVGNLDPSIAAAAQQDYVERLRRAWARNGLTSFAYHTTSPDPNDKVVSMGGVQPDTGRNTNGLRPAISLLLEVRGVGLGRAHLLRRVHTAVIAGITVAQVAAEQGNGLLALVRRAEADTAAQACQGQLVVAARHSSAKQQLVFVDAVTGADKAIDVEWRAAIPLDVQRVRARPCGYLVAGDQAQAIDRLRLLGVRVHAVEKASRWDVERYVVVSDGSGQRQDARGAIDDGGDGPIRVFEVRTQQAQDDEVVPGTMYIPLDQPLAAIISAALEPDSQNSYAANRLLDLEAAELRRVMARPMPDWLGQASR
jgi:hypothetical protein